MCWILRNHRFLGTSKFKQTGSSPSVKVPSIALPLVASQSKARKRYRLVCIKKWFLTLQSYKQSCSTNKYLSMIEVQLVAIILITSHTLFLLVVYNKT